MVKSIQADALTARHRWCSSRCFGGHAGIEDHVARDAEYGAKAKGDSMITFSIISTGRD
jgi:hypothetical protein